MANHPELIKTSLNEDDVSLISSHYINEVLPTTKLFKEFHIRRLLQLVDDPDRPLAEVLRTTKQTYKKTRERERYFEDTLIRPIMEALGNTVKAQVALNGDAVDFCVYQPDETIPPDGFAKNYANTIAIIEAKKYGRIENKYFIGKEDNTDEVYQTLHYLDAMNQSLRRAGQKHRVSYIILTDGYLWRIYSRDYCFSEKEYQSHFIEFNLEAIVNLPDKEERNHYLKIFGMFFCPQSLGGAFARFQKESSELEMAVTTGLREQTYTALEYIATGLWRAIMRDGNPLLATTLLAQYHIDVEKARTDEEERSSLLKVVYDESVVYLLRLLFVLYAEDRNLFDPAEIPKIIKGSGHILDRIMAQGKGIGEITKNGEIDCNDDVKLADIFQKVDRKYNGGLFSAKKHPLLYKLDIEDNLFANAIDNLCRVQVRNRIYTVDFSNVSIRELGGIYESLLEYKLAVIDKDTDELPSIINKKRVRHHVARGDLYLINHKGERKATGSYYTPDLIVEHLVKNTLDSKLAEAEKQADGRLEDLFRNVFAIKVCDPAMGSGHMLLAAYTHIVSFLHQTVEEWHGGGKTERVWNDALEYYVRTQVARRCIYGVDLNPMAVELAKLVMWMKVFRNDKPFEFFDYNLACGNSLIGVYDETKAADDPYGKALFRTQEEMEADIQGDLLKAVAHMMDMPRDTVEEVHAVEQYWHGKVQPLQREVSFFYNIKLAQWLLPEQKETVLNGYTELIQGIDRDETFVSRLLQGDPAIPEHVRKFADIDREIRARFHPLHWKVVYPHIAVQGGFSVILSNPPWDLVKSDHRDFFIDYIDGYKELETAAAKKQAKEYLETHPIVKRKWDVYQKSVEVANAFYQNAYHYQIYRDSKGKKLKGYNNLYKVFIEKIYTILSNDGACGIVIPDNLNIDNGCTGLRHLILDHTTIQELIMFENKKKLFDIHGQYKFDVLTFIKKKPRSNGAFRAGFYWYDPIWLDHTPDSEYIAQNEKNRKEYHTVFSYSLPLIRKMSPETYTVFEFRNRNIMQIFEKMLAFPAIADEREDLSISTFTEFNMTFDSDLFHLEKRGWPLYQGKTIHFYNNHLHPIERFITPELGEKRLAKRWKLDVHDLPDRTYRIGWRDIAQPTDSRSLICTVIPRGVFCGNKIDQAKVMWKGSIVKDPELIAGVNAVMASFTADMYIRQRIAKTVNAFILKSLPLPRDMAAIRQLGEMALPLFGGDEYDRFRGDIPAITDDEQRQKLMARLDARVALLYGLTAEEYQTVMDTFPLVDETYKKRCNQAYSDWYME